MVVVEGSDRLTDGLPVQVARAAAPAGAPGAAPAAGRGAGDGR